MAKSPAINAAKAVSLSNPPAVSPNPSSPAGGSDAPKSALGITDDTSGLLGVAVDFERRRGRGAISNASGRYEPTARIAFDDGWRSLDELPPFKTEVTVDATRTMKMVDRLRAQREFRDVKVSPLVIAARAVCLAVRRTPEVNSAWDEANQEIVLKHYVNLGIAAATPRGLVVPNIKDAERLSLLELASALSEVVETARAGKTQPAEMSGGTFTITNVGVFGIDSGTPIINPGESAILAFGAIKKQPWVVDDEVVVRQVTTLALSFDHRHVDGERGSRFLADVAGILEDPASALLF